LKLIAYSVLKRKKASIIIIEPHGDLSDQVAKWKEFKDKKHINKLVYIHPYLKD